MRLFHGRLFAGGLFAGQLFRGLLLLPVSPRSTGSGTYSRTIPWPQRRRRLGPNDDEIVMLLLHACGN